MFDGRGDEVDVRLDHGRNVRQWRFRAQHHEEVGEAVACDAHVRGGAVAPLLVEGDAVAAFDVQLAIRAVEGVEAGRADQHVEGVERAIGQSSPCSRDLGDGVLSDIDDVDILAVKGLVVARVAQRTAVVQRLGCQLAPLLGVPDNLRDLGPDELAGGFVGGLVGGQVGKSAQQETDPATLVPAFLVDALSLLRGHVEGFDRGLDEARAGEGRACTAPQLVVRPVDLVALLAGHGATHRGDAVLRRSLEREQRADFWRYRRDELYARGPVADDADLFIGEVVRFRPPRRVIQFASKAVAAWDAGPVRLTEKAQRGHDVAGREDPVACVYAPQVILFVPLHREHLGVELHAAPQVVPVDDVVQVCQAFFAVEIVVRPGICLQVLLVPGVSV